MSSLISAAFDIGKKLPGWVWEKKEWVVGFVAASIFFRKIVALARSRHSILYTKGRGADCVVKIEKHIFPHMFVNADGLVLYTRRWVVPQPRGLVFIVHGFGEHIGRYEHVAQKLNSLGLSVYGMDHQGHGQSEGDRGYVESFQHYVRDYLQFVRHVQSEFKSPLPSFVYGHSMGGAVTVLLAHECKTKEEKDAKSSGVWPWTGVVLSSPALVPDKDAATPMLRFLARVLSGVLPKLGVSKLDHSAVSRISGVVDRYREDPLVYKGTLSARWGNEMLGAMDDIRAKLSAISFPFLLVQGTQDRICSAEGAETFVQYAGSLDKFKREYPGGYHELHNDLESQKVLDDIATWLEARLPH